MQNTNEKSHTVKPYAFIVSFGLVSMLMDIVYEGALAVQGPLLASLGATSVIVGLVSGLGEATSLAGRLFSGPLADRTGRYWTFAILGYAATALAVPAMGFVGSLVGVSALVIYERFGKSLRTPSRDSMLSHAASAVGRGKGFALHEVMDQIGAVTGPLIVAGLLSITQNDYRVALGALIIPGVAAICVLLVLRHRVPNPSIYEQSNEGKKHDSNNKLLGLPRKFWAYTFSCALVLVGVATFGVISYHMVSSKLCSDALVPAIYAIAMCVDAIFAAITGFLFDKAGPKILLTLPIVCAAIPFFAYSETLWIVILGVVLWGASLGIQESTMRAAVAGMVESDKRASAYGMFSIFIGIGTLLGGIIAGALYAVSTFAIISFAVVVETIAFVVMLYVLKYH